MATKEQKKGRVAFLHPDLGLGGAERLIVDAAVGLQHRGYEVTVYTGYHDQGHAFPETTDGTLNVVPVGQWIPRSFCGRLVALFAYFKMIVIALYLALVSVNKSKKPDVVIVDQVSACIPFLRLVPLWPPIGQGVKVMFYCHFPDLLLATRDSSLKSLYRKPLDFFEEKTTGCADKVVVNSEFTKGIFKKTFTSLRVNPGVLYPSINSKMFDDFLKSKANVQVDIPKAKYTFLSINRFEPKKNIALAIRAMKKLRTCVDESAWKETHLVLAGGYDPRLESSVTYLEKLKQLAEDEGVADHITFVLSPKDAAKMKLLQMCVALVYTPSEEHFGIVPLEAMYMSKPVIAVNSGGPRETVADDTTGFLCPATETHFATAMGRIVEDLDLAKELGKAGKQRYMENFSFEAFSTKWEDCVSDLMSGDKKHGD